MPSNYTRIASDGDGPAEDIRWTSILFGADNPSTNGKDSKNYQDTLREHGHYDGQGLWQAIRESPLD